MRAIFALFIFSTATLYAQGLKLHDSSVIGHSCVLDRIRNGTCILFSNCPNAKAASRPKICGFQGKHPIICCHLSLNEKNCIKWQVYKERRKSGKFSVAGVAGEDSLAKEFPHMAVLGYGAEHDTKWLCGGSLISEKFVLTAAHCINARDVGDVQFVRLGDLDLKKTDDEADPQNFRVVRRIKHPQYRQSLNYHDIALLELDRPAKFTDYVYPACLQSTKKIATDGITATRWGRLSFNETQADHLQKFSLTETKNEDCRKSYGQDSRRLPNGILDEMHICALGNKMDTCPGDSGGPMQAPSTNCIDMFVIIGITSFGKACGMTNIPGVYTRVSNYVDWIEAIVWKN